MAISLAIRAKWIKQNIYFLTCLPMLRNDPSSISTGKYEFVWGVPYYGPPSKIALFDPFESKFELSPAVKIDAE
jgi:hypothetical protein